MLGSSHNKLKLKHCGFVSLFATHKYSLFEWSAKGKKVKTIKSTITCTGQN